MEIVQREGNRNVKRMVDTYNLDAIIAVGDRVNSKKATEFRIWATKILKAYITKGFALNDERFINGNKYDTQYFDELLERIKAIRASERMAYQKITDLFIATSTDYNPKSEEAYTFFKIVQNKLHYAISGHTAAELIFNRADSTKEHMGLTNWKNSPDGLIYKYDVSIAKNYLNKEELEKFLDWLWDFEFNLYGLPVPTEVFFLNMPVEKSLELIKDRDNKFTNTAQKDIHESDVNHLKDAHKAACYVAKKYNWYEINCVDSNNNIRTIEDIHEEIYRELSKTIIY